MIIKYFNAIKILVCVFSFLNLLNASQQESNALVSKIDAAAFTMKRSEHLMFLISLVAPDSPCDETIKAIAAIDLKDKFIPEGVIYKWKQSNSLSSADIIKFINTRSEEEVNSWLKQKNISIVEKSSRNFTLRIQRSQIEKLKLLGVEEMSVADIIGSIREKTIAEGIKFDKFERVDILQPHGFSQWIAVGLYQDINGELRMTALINPQNVILDRPKEEPDF
jgi:hypothetical protein